MDKTKKIAEKEKLSGFSRYWQFIFIIFITLVAGIIFAVWSYHKREAEMRTDLINDAQLIGNSIDWRNLQKLTANETDVNLPGYIRLKEQLTLIRSANELCRFIYLMGRKEDGSIFFFVDSEPPDSEDYSHPGQPYPEATTQLKSVFILGKPITEGPIPDEWGTWISAIVPLSVPNDNKILAILGMDVDAKEWIIQKNEALTIPISVTIVILILETIYFILRLRIERENRRLTQSKELLRQSEVRYRLLVEHAPAGIFEIDLKTNKFISVNDVMCNYLGYTKEEMLSFGPEKVLTNDSLMNYRKRVEIVTRGESIPLAYEHKAITKNGNEVWALVNSQFFIENDVPVRVTGVLHDITDRKMAEQALLKAKILAEKSDKLKDAFIANISHEIRTPLNSILGFSDLLPDMIKEDDQDAASHIFEIINNSGKRLMRTVDMIMNFSRLQIGEFPVHFEEINIPELLQSLIKEFNVLADEKSLPLIFENQCGNLILVVDEYCITQAIYDLLDNAIKFTNKGHVKLILSKVDQNKAMIDIEDTGIGISEDYLNHLFEPFSQEDSSVSRSFEGVGLSLSIVKKLLDLNNAEITVDSTKNVGTTFHIKFNLG